MDYPLWWPTETRRSQKWFFFHDTFRLCDFRHLGCCYTKSTQMSNKCEDWQQRLASITRHNHSRAIRQKQVSFDHLHTHTHTQTERHVFWELSIIRCWYLHMMPKRWEIHLSLFSLSGLGSVLVLVCHCCCPHYFSGVLPSQPCQSSNLGHPQQGAEATGRWGKKKKKIKDRHLVSLSVLLHLL